MKKDVDTESDAERLAKRIKMLRQRQQLTLSRVEAGCGVRASTISKIERGAISPSYATLIRLAKGLGVELAELVTADHDTGLKTRRAITRDGEGPVHSIGTHDYRFLCSELTQKKMNPMIATVKARSLVELKTVKDRQSGLFSHDGEEVLYVISGSVVLYTEFYNPVTMHAGDCAYIDSTMGHACVAAEHKDATLFWVCTDLAIKPNTPESSVD